MQSGSSTVNCRKSQRISRGCQGSFATFRNDKIQIHLECFGKISRREKLALLKEDLEKLLQPTEQLSELISEVRNLTKRDRLDITDGWMASQTAEAVYITLLRALRYIQDYFTYIEQGDLVEKIQLKCLTTTLVECFFGHITENVPTPDTLKCHVILQTMLSHFCFLTSIHEKLASQLEVKRTEELQKHIHIHKMDFKLAMLHYFGDFFP